MPRTLEDSRGSAGRRHPCPYTLGTVGVTARKEACGFSSRPGQEPLSQQHSSWLCFLSAPISPQAPFASLSLLPTEASPSSQIVQQPGQPEAFLPSPWCPGRRHRALPDPSHQARHGQWGSCTLHKGPVCTVDNADRKVCRWNPADGSTNAFSHSPYDSVPAKVPRGRGAFKNYTEAPSIPGLDGHPRLPRFLPGLTGCPALAASPLACLSLPLSLCPTSAAALSRQFLPAPRTPHLLAGM